MRDVRNLLLYVLAGLGVILFVGALVALVVWLDPPIGPIGP